MRSARCALGEAAIRLLLYGDAAGAQRYRDEAAEHADRALDHWQDYKPPEWEQLIADGTALTKHLEQDTPETGKPGEWTPTADGLGATRTTGNETAVAHVQMAGPDRQPIWRAGWQRQDGGTEWTEEQYQNQQEAQEAIWNTRPTPQ